jgi:DNA replication and repair protein RecF
VTFSPTDVELVRGGPVERRAYLDVVLATTSRRYLAALQTYRAALLRRNAALRAVGDDADASQLEPWEPLLAQAGAVVWLERAVWVRTWGRELARVAAEIGERESIELRHVARLPGGRDALATGDLDGLRSAFAAALAAGRALDARHRATRIGPHRDDLLITVGERDLRTYASAGQHRTVAIALRIVEAATLRTHSGATPLLLLDDPFAELDERRARAILGVLGGDDMGQIVLAVPRSSDIPAGLTRLARITIAGGVISPPLQGAGHAAA